MRTASTSKRDAVRAFAAEISAMSDAERATLAAHLPTVVNPEGHSLSFRNTALLYMQSGGEIPLTVVAGFAQWKRAGRIVRKGQKSIGMILVPMRIRDPKPGGRDMWFKNVPVFDISQTDDLQASQTAAEAA